MSGILNRILKLEKNFEKAIEDVGHVALELEEVAIKKTRDLLEMARYFFRLQATGGILLVLAALVALVIANTPLHEFYGYVLNQIEFRIGFDAGGNGFDKEIKKPLLLWINDGLMALFFFLIGLEIKREIIEGEFSKKGRVILPVFAAAGGMTVPVAIYWFINRNNPAGLDGWAIPLATDIAFALGVLALMGARAPLSMKILHTTIGTSAKSLNFM
jgi:NhaA family Na+:H+ antiporter